MNIFRKAVLAVSFAAVLLVASPAPKAQAAGLPVADILNWISNTLNHIDNMGLDGAFDAISKLASAKEQYKWLKNIAEDVAKVTDFVSNVLKIGAEVGRVGLMTKYFVDYIKSLSEMTVYFKLYGPPSIAYASVSCFQTYCNVGKSIVKSVEDLINQIRNLNNPSALDVLKMIDSVIIDFESKVMNCISMFLNRMRYMFYWMEDSKRVKENLFIRNTMIY